MSDATRAPILVVKGTPFATLRAIGILSLVVPAGIVLSLWGSRLGQTSPGRSLLGLIPKGLEGPVVVVAALLVFVAFWAVTITWLSATGPVAFFEDRVAFASGSIGWDALESFDDSRESVRLFRRGMRIPHVLAVETDDDRVALIALLERKGVRRVAPEDGRGANRV